VAGRRQPRGDGLQRCRVRLLNLIPQQPRRAGRGGRQAGPSPGIAADVMGG